MDALAAMCATVTIRKGGRLVKRFVPRPTGPPFRVPPQAHAGDIVPLQGDPALPDIRPIVAKLWRGVDSPRSCNVV